MKKMLLLLPLVLLACDNQDTYTVQKYEWRASKQLNNISTAAYTIRHGKSTIEAECIGTRDEDGFKPLSCSPPLPVGKDLPMKPDGHELLVTFNGKEVHLEVISEEVK